MDSALLTGVDSSALRALEDVPEWLRGGGWVQIGIVYSTASTDGTSMPTSRFP